MGMSTEKPHNGRKKESQFAIFAQSSGRGERFAQTKKAHAKTYFFSKKYLRGKRDKQAALHAGRQGLRKRRGF